MRTSWLHDYYFIIIILQFARELFSDLKRARRLEQQINKAQGRQKEQYDKSANESVVKEKDLLMLKVEPLFKLDEVFRGPYHVEGVMLWLDQWMILQLNLKMCRFRGCPSVFHHNHYRLHGKKRNRWRCQVFKPREPQNDDGNITESQQTFETRYSRSIQWPARCSTTRKEGEGGCKMR